jgi:acetyl/propionyl-CoA carboxylase alpha subunit
MFASVLIANRGEIACRIMRTAKRMGLETIAVYSDADGKAMHARMADKSVRLGPAPAVESYLNAERLLAAARDTDAEAIHPGYGFLSENADFAQAVTDAGLIWIGPSPAAIRAMGAKDAAKERMASAGVAVTPGYHGVDQSDGRLKAAADHIGYPVLIKAVAGGGGKGMRRVDTAADFAAALVSCRREALASFKDDKVLIEKYISRPRHIEVQVFADTFGNAVHLFERDCSLQRRHQKVIEEAPAPGMDAPVRDAICAAAIRAAQAVDYQGAGTIEFIADASAGLKAERIWFMEMNTRLQVEHPVTEMITGLDLVEWQLRIAAGEPLPLRQHEIAFSGHAVEARLYAEDTQADFLPSVGPLSRLHFPNGVRVDAGVVEGDAVSPHYDPMLAKLIAHGASREAAVSALAEACRRTEVWPVKTNAAFLARTLSEPDFIAGRVDTDFIPARLDRLRPRPAPSQDVLLSAATTMFRSQASPDRCSPWASLHGLRLNAAPNLVVELEDERQRYAVRLPQPLTQAALPSAMFGQQVVAFDAGECYAFASPRPKNAIGGATAASGKIVSPMPGSVVALAVKPGDVVREGQPLATLEAMKMEYTLRAPFAGKVEQILVHVGAIVSDGAILIDLAALDQA